jgi:hypothetical protein
MALIIDIGLVVFFVLVSVYLSLRQMLYNLSKTQQNDSELCLAAKYHSYWKLLETTIPCAVILWIVVDLPSETCRTTPLHCQSNYHMHFISCDLQRCKYSEHLECIALPILALICHALIVTSTYDTLQTWGGNASSFGALLSYLAILGFSGVILFDSQGISSLERNWHFIGVSVLTLSVWLLHAKCLLELSKLISQIDTEDRLKHVTDHTVSARGLGTNTRRNYTVVEAVYILALTSFGVAFVYGIPMAIQLEYSVLFCVLALAIINAITFHMTYEYIFSMTDSRMAIVKVGGGECSDCDDSSHSNSSHIVVLFGCFIASLPVIAIKTYTSHADYLHQLTPSQHVQQFHH